VNWNSFPFEGKKVVTNGCFELIHPGHIDYLQKAASLGDFLIVGINSDDGLLDYKKKVRTSYTERDRAVLLAALECVSYVTIFPSKNAKSFLSIVKPDVYIKGGDYSLDTLDKEEKAVLDGYKTEIKFIPFLEGYSTTKIVEKIKSL
jgi:rfaE bifunctional protein nucleotidyltransferase chain/domain